MKAVIVVFPGSNCDRDAKVAIEAVTGRAAAMIWHGEPVLPPADLVVLPGGFSYGDYLRPGAMAARSPIMQAVIQAAKRGVRVLGICNGFQMLTECSLLPGALLRNAKLRFVCRAVRLRVETADNPFTKRYQAGNALQMPVAHHDGNYFADTAVLERLAGDDRIVFRYLDNPNGSAGDIAGILNEGRNVLGMMPHPERAAEALLGSTDGRALFESLVA
ncbi:MAG: phosphoribosylformylglycinamidine synthase subunit PurQ [Alphaproteobacteria bacterium]|nr:phosphoribosylformylglycinamidine synthase subunit PurQ [Alphaproteobacteria bacterium]